MPAYKITHPEFSKPRAVEAGSPREARAHVAKEMTIKPLSAREAFDLGEQGVKIAVVVRRPK